MATVQDHQQSLYNFPKVAYKREGLFHQSFSKNWDKDKQDKICCSAVDCCQLDLIGI